MHISRRKRERGRRRRAEEDEAAGVTVNWRERCASEVLAGRPMRVATSEKLNPRNNKSAC